MPDQASADRPTGFRAGVGVTATVAEETSRRRVLRCLGLFVAAITAMSAHVDAGLWHWVARVSFMLAAALCFSHTRKVFVGVAADLARMLRFPATFPAQVQRPEQETARKKHTVESWTWSDDGDSIRVRVHAEHPGAPPPTAAAEVMPDSFRLVIQTKSQDLVLEKKGLFGTVDPRKSRSHVDSATGTVTLVLHKWHDSRVWDVLLDDGRHPMSRVDLSALAGVTGTKHPPE